MLYNPLKQFEISTLLVNPFLYIFILLSLFILYITYNNKLYIKNVLLLKTKKFSKFYNNIRFIRLIRVNIYFISCFIRTTKIFKLLKFYEKNGAPLWLFIFFIVLLLFILIISFYFYASSWDYNSYELKFQKYRDFCIVFLIVLGYMTFNDQLDGRNIKTYLKLTIIYESMAIYCFLLETRQGRALFGFILIYYIVLLIEDKQVTKDLNNFYNSNKIYFKIFGLIMACLNYKKYIDINLEETAMVFTFFSTLKRIEYRKIAIRLWEADGTKLGPFIIGGSFLIGLEYNNNELKEKHNLLRAKELIDYTAQVECKKNALNEQAALLEDKDKDFKIREEAHIARVKCFEETVLLEYKKPIVVIKPQEKAGNDDSKV